MRFVQLAWGLQGPGPASERSVSPERPRAAAVGLSAGERAHWLRIRQRPTSRPPSPLWTPRR